MVDWARVETLRSKGWDWDRIADDPKVGFHPDASVHEPGRALRGLYHRQLSHQRRRGESPSTGASSPTERAKVDGKWSLPRIGFLLLPILAVWFTFAFLVPSPVGLVLPAIPYLALGLVVAAFVLLFGLFRTSGARWSKVYRTTLVTGVVLGLVVSGVIALGGILFFGCPVLPSAASGTTQPAPDWISVDVAPWQDSGRPVVFFFAATWCPFCSASSWAIWKALSGFGTVTGTSTMYSAEGSVPEVVLASAHVSSTSVALVVVEDTSGDTHNFPSTTNCYEQAYVSAYSGGAIPFLVVNGQYVHAGSSLVPADQVTSFSTAQLEQEVSIENGSAWTIIQGPTWWMMAFIAKSTGATPGNLAQQPYFSGWSAATKSSVASDLARIH